MAISSPRLQLPTESEIKLSQVSSRILSAHLGGATRQLKVVEEDGSEETVEIPASALHLLVDILAQMAQGNAVTLIPIHAELTTQESADILNVSRPFLIKLLESGEIPYRTVGKHRRICFQDLMAYKQKTDAARSQALNDLVLQAQELGMGY
ncbi:MAG: helix-turn-helix domain-containing protein [Cyanobacteriota bacterium]|nr:helix-turn-helix domain-containing protein [Cyanobacteriota bacterium]